MAATPTLKAAGLLAACGIIATGALYQPVSSPVDTYAATVKLAAGISAVAGSFLLSSAIGRTLLRNAGRSAFKALYVAALASAGVGVAEAASAAMPVNVAAALCVTSAVFAVAGLWTVRFFQAGGA